jgi:hypothetical protein
MIALFAEAPALPLHTAGPYVAAAYLVFLLVVLLYVWIMARKLISGSRELRDLKAQLDEREHTGAGPAGPAPVQERAESPLEPAAHE